MKQLYIALTLFFLAVNTYGQAALAKVINTNKATFSYQQGQFKGDGWDKIMTEIASHKNTLIGEDHFFNEIPLFVSEITSKIKFDNFFCEIDPYSGDFISQKIHKLPQDKLDQFITDYKYAFSFYALAPEFQLLKKLIKKGTNIIGTDQIALTADGLIASKLKEITQHKKAKELYSNISINSKKQFELFTSGKGSPYLFTDEFEQNLQELEKLKLSASEQKIIASLKLSREIYRDQNHHLRIQLMKNEILKNIEAFNTGKNLFKYGAIHVNKAQSILGGYDIGNFVSNISDANFESSLHIMIIGKNGIQGVPFEGMEPQKINPSGNDLKHYAPFFEASDAIHWSLFDISQILKTIKSDKLQIEDETLKKTLHGFDYIIVIPNVTPAPFMN